MWQEKEITAEDKEGCFLLRFLAFEILRSSIIFVVFLFTPFCSFDTVLIENIWYDGMSTFPSYILRFEHLH